MTTEIHYSLEERRRYTTKDKPKIQQFTSWKDANHYRKNQFSNEFQINNSDLSIDRVYELFAQLANIRNDDKNFSFIDNPRGLPNDITQETKVLYQNWNDNNESESYVTLNDLINHFKKHPLVADDNKIFGHNINDSIYKLIKDLIHEQYITNLDYLNKSQLDNNIKYINNIQYYDLTRGVSALLNHMDKLDLAIQDDSQTRQKRNQAAIEVSDLLKTTQRGDDIRLVFWFTD